MSSNFNTLTHGSAIDAAEELAHAHPQQIDAEDLTAALVNALRRIEVLENDVRELREGPELKAI